MLQWADQRGGLRERDYRVASVTITEPQHLNLDSTTSDDELTLLTCYPFGPQPTSPQRLIVHATPTGPSRAVEATEGHTLQARG